jgi:putative DNA primase/helicase
MEKEYKFSDEDLLRWKQDIHPAPIIGTRVELHQEKAEWVGCCPDVYHKQILGKSDTNPSLKFWKSKDGTWTFKCFSCQSAGNLFQFVQKFDGISFKDAVDKVLLEAGTYGWVEGQAQPEPAGSASKSKPNTVATFPMSQYKPAIAALETSIGGQHWLASRGISMEIAREFYLGFVQSAEKVTTNNAWMKGGWITFPTLSADRKTVTAVKYRSLVAKKVIIDGRENSGILRARDTSTTMFNLLTADLSGDVWVVEGEPDTLVMKQAGCETVGWPMAGYNLTDDECALLSTAKRRFLAGDSDKPGVKAMDDLQKKLSGATYRILWPNNRKDANDVLTNECDNDPVKFKALVENLKTQATQTESLAIVRRGSDIAPKLIHWLWQDRIPVGKLTLFAGNPDNGKSLASASIAALCTRGAPLPASKLPNPVIDVLMLIGEDDPDDTAVPRLIAAGADMKRVHFLESVKPVKSKHREIRLDMDIPAIEGVLAANPEIGLLIIDPISNYLGEVNMIAEQEVRSILIPLKRAAEKHNIAVLVIMHLNKKTDLDAISRVGGAMAFIGVARCSWLFVRDVREEEMEGDPEADAERPKSPDSFSMLRIKNNLVSSSRAGLAYCVSTRQVEIEGTEVHIPYVAWGGIIEGSADEALGGAARRRGERAEPGEHRGMGRPNVELQRAIKWLSDALQDGQPRPVKILKADAQGEMNVSPRTLMRAWGAIEAKSVQIRGIWHWQIDPMHAVREPDEEAQTPQQGELAMAEGAVE